MDFDGRGKWQKIASVNSLDNVVFRLLCPASKTAGLIGKGGATISQIRQETGAKITVEESIPGYDDRIVIIAGSGKEVEASIEVNEEDGDKEANVGDENKDCGNGDEDKGASTVEVSKENTSSLKTALMLVFERMVEAESEVEGGGGDGDKTGGGFVLRLLVVSSQVGCLLGEGGSVIK